MIPGTHQARQESAGENEIRQENRPLQRWRDLNVKRHLPSITPRSLHSSDISMHLDQARKE